MAKVHSLLPGVINQTPNGASGAEILVASIFPTSAPTLVLSGLQDQLKSRMSRACACISAGLKIEPPDCAKPYCMVTTGLVKHPPGDPFELYFGFDSMSDRCILPHRFLPPNFDLSKAKPTLHTLQGVTGHTLGTNCELSLTVSFGDCDFEIPFLVVESDALPFPLIGYDFWKAQKVNQDWERHEIVLSPPDTANCVQLPIMNPSGGTLPLPVRSLCLLDMVSLCDVCCQMRWLLMMPSI